MDWTVSIAIIDWLFLLALFPVAFFWLRRAWRILVRRDFSEVALKRGVAPPNAEKYAPFEMAINLIGGGVMLGVLVSVLLIPLLAVAGVVGEAADAYILGRDQWIAVAGSTLWIKIFASFALSRQAHGFDTKKKAADARRAR